MTDVSWTELPERQLVHLEPSQIIFEDRARETYDNLSELAESIKEKGVIQTLAVQATEDPSRYRLLGGGRRYSAAVLARLRPLPCLVFPVDMSDLDRKEVELYENIHRESLTWIEESRLHRDIHRMMEERHGIAASGGTGGSIGHSQADTAELMGKDRSTISKSIARADAVEQHPELAKAKTASDADKILRQINRRSEAKKAAAQYEDERKSYGDEDQQKRALANGYMVGDFFERAKDLPDGMANIVEIDPPYGIALEDIKRAHPTKTEGYTEVEDTAYPEFLDRVIEESVRLLLGGGWIICWHAFQWQREVRDSMEKHGLNVCPIPAFWVKTSQGQTNAPQTRLGSVVEPFLYGCKPGGFIVKQGRNNRFEYAPAPSEDKIHPTERPVEMIQEVLSTFAQPNTTCIVPFLGSGSTLLAMSNVGIKGFGFDLDDGGIYRDAFVQRVQKGRIGQYRSYPIK